MMITEQQLSQLKKELLDQKQRFEITIDEDSFENRSAHENLGELSMYDNHPADLATGFYEREKDMALSVHAQDEYNKALHALKAMENGTYGRCEVCGTEILYERLEVLPATTFCKEHSPDQRIPGDRPVEEDVIEPAHENSYSYRLRSPVKDYEDSFEEVAKYGTSETPSDFIGDFDDYNELYRDESTDGTQEQYETFSVTDITGNERDVLEVDNQIKYQDMLTEFGMESQLGDIPYYEKDSYLEENEEEK